MKKIRCPICRSRDVRTVRDVLICFSCDTVISNHDAITALNKIVSELEKQKAKSEYNESMTKLQQEATKKPYLRFRFYELE